MVAWARASGVGLVGPDGLTGQVLEFALEEEFADRLGCPSGERDVRTGADERDGSRSKVVITQIGSVQIGVPCDREGDFAPVIVTRRQRPLGASMSWCCR